MKPLRPYRIDLFNIADQTSFGTYYSNQVPQRGDLINYLGHYAPGSGHRQGDAYEGWPIWKVGQVSWKPASPGSRTASELAREAESSEHGNGYCDWVQLHVMPAQGPFYVKTPSWAKMAAPASHAIDEPEKEPSDEPTP